MTAWLRILRLPNLLTVPGDVLAGFFLVYAALPQGSVSMAAFAPALALAAGSSLCIYCAGLLFNDAADARIDAAERPERPIPSGAIPRRAAFMAGACFTLGGLAFARFAGESSLSAAGAEAPIALFAGTAAEMRVAACLAVALALAAAAVVYDFSPFRRRFAAPSVLLMGACRGLNVLLGAAVLLPDLCCAQGMQTQAAIANALWGAAAVAVYTAAFSVFARNEAEAEPAPSKKAYLPFIAVCATLAPAVAIALMSGGDEAGAVFGAGSLAVSAYSAACYLPVFALALAALHSLVLARFYAPHVSAPEITGRFVGNIMRVQAALAMCAWRCDTALAAGLALFFLPAVFKKLAARFPPS